jgi:hypothetical protein
LPVDASSVSVQINAKRRTRGMYYFDILELLKKGERLSANDIFIIMHEKGRNPNIRNIRDVLFKMFISNEHIQRESEHANTGGVKYYYFYKGAIKKTAI